LFGTLIIFKNHLKAQKNLAASNNEVDIIWDDGGLDDNRYILSCRSYVRFGCYQKYKDLSRSERIR